MLTTSCATPSTQAEQPAAIAPDEAAKQAGLVDRPAPPKAAASVPCLNLKPIVYHAPKTVADVDLWRAGKLPDPDNHFDRPDTADAIRKYNAVVTDRCPA